MTDIIERVKRQEELNKLMSDLGDTKYINNANRIAKVGGFGETQGGLRATDQALQGFVQMVDEYAVNCTASKDGRKPTIIKKLIVKYSSEKIVYRINPSMIGRIAIKGILKSLVRPEDKRIVITTVASAIGDMLEYAVKAIVLDTHYAEAKRKKMDMLRRQGRLDDPQEIEKVMNDLAITLEIDHEPWTNHEQMEIGYACLQLLKQSKAWVKMEGFGDEKQEVTFGDFFLEIEESTFNFAAKHLKSRKTFRVSEKGLNWLTENEEFMQGLTFSFLPMVVPPVDWGVTEERIVGGFNKPSINTRYTLMKGLSNKELLRLYERYPAGFDTLIRAINIAQKVPFKVNKTVYSAAKWVNDNKIPLDRKGIPTYRCVWAEEIGSEAKAQEYFDLSKQMVYGPDKKRTKESWELLDAYLVTIIPGGAAMETEALRAEWFAKKDKIKQAERAEASKAILIDNIINEAKRFLEDEAIYFPYNADFRGRIYPLTGLFSPQGSDTSRGMLEFANPVKAEGEHTIDNIAYQIANAAGEDKLSIEGRIEWTWDNTLDILAYADNFIENRGWMDADKPFLFLLGCIEWAKVQEAVFANALDPSKDRYDFYTSMPVGFDGSCNGIQNFSAMLRDPEGAAHVNLVASDEPADVYKVVAQAALKAALNDSTEKKWKRFVAQLDEELDGNLFDRKSAKRATMTLPYGVSPESAGKYVLEEVDKIIRHVEMTPSERKNTRRIVKKLIWDSILANVKAPVIAKNYFQKVAKAMAADSCSIEGITSQEECEEAGGEWTNGRGLMWFTPTNLPIKQAYFSTHPKYKRIKVTVNGQSIDRHYPKYTTSLDPKEQANGVTPNFVHSFDSAHLQLTVIAADKEGMESFLLIHDSFATDANNATRFNHIIREQFVSMYLDRDYIQGFHNDCVKQHGGTLFDEKGDEILPIPLGDFDVRKVLESLYFFS